jgi:putative heme-binding domain-containing protein
MGRRALPFLLALTMAAAQDPSAAVKQVLDVALSMQERESAVKTLALNRAGGLALLKLVDEGKLPDELKATASFACGSSPDADVRAEAAKKLPLPKSRDGRIIPPIVQLMTRKGDLKTGAAVFRDPQKANCIACHQIGDDGRLVGPPLTTIGNKLSKEQLFESILTPSAGILMGYENWAVRTTDGDVLTGIKVEDTDDHITLKDTQGEFIDIPVKKIGEKRMLRLSMMPENLASAMTVQDLVDLVEYLSEQR